LILQDRILVLLDMLKRVLILLDNLLILRDDTLIGEDSLLVIKNQFLICNDIMVRHMESSLSLCRFLLCTQIVSPSTYPVHSSFIVCGRSSHEAASSRDGRLRSRRSSRYRMNGHAGHR